MEEAVTIRWRRVRRTTNRQWRRKRCLYLLTCETSGEPVYIGKAGRCGVSDRVLAAEKDRIRQRLGGRRPGPYSVRVGTVHWGRDRRYSERKLAAIESVLIYALKPPAKAGPDFASTAN